MTNTSEDLNWKCPDCGGYLGRFPDVYNQDVMNVACIGQFIHDCHYWTWEPIPRMTAWDHLMAAD